jgi:hypothetical protein
LLAAQVACNSDRATLAGTATGELLAQKLPRIEYRGGPFLRRPRVTTVTFANDEPELVSRLEQFGSMIARSAWWRAVTEGYCSAPDVCIEDGEAVPPVKLDAALPLELHDTEIDALVLRAAGAGELGPIDENTLFVVYLPKGTALRNATTIYCTGKARAFHRSLALGGMRVPFAVVPRCGGEAELTASASHEILEATTNPFPADRGFAFPPGSSPSGFSAAGLEPVDPCGLVTRDDHRSYESGFVVQRAWSNRAAALGLDPCVPSKPAQSYVMLVPREPGVRLARTGETATLELIASTASGDHSWAISAYDLSGAQDHERYVEVALDKTRVENGETVILSVKALKSNASRRVIVALVSTIDERSSMWPLLVVLP